MPDYSKAKIYAIRAPGTDSVYIGATTKPLLSQRMAEHRAHFKRWEEGKENLTCSAKILDYEGAYIELIEEFPCQTKDQLNRREGEIIRQTPNCINKYVTGRTVIEYISENKEARNEKSRNWYYANREKINAAKRAKRENIPGIKIECPPSPSFAPS